MTTRVSSVIGAACSIAMLVSSATAQLKISQVYGAGGDFGAVVNRDYVELFNPTAVPVSLDG